MLQKELIYHSAALLRILNEAGYDCEADDDFESILAKVQMTGKEDQGPKFSVLRNDFTKGTAFWAFLMSGDRRIGGVAARMFDLNGESLADYIRRTSNAQFGGGQSVVQSVAPPLENMTGRMVFFGELHIAKDVRGSRKVLTAFNRMSMILAAMSWPDFDWMYAFLAKNHARAADMYGFTYRLPRVVTWRKPMPEGRDDTHMVAAINSLDLQHMLTSREMSEF